MVRVYWLVMLLLWTLCVPAHALPLDQYEKLKSTADQNGQLKVFLLGSLDGIISYNRSLPSLNAKPLFCLPPTVTGITVDEFKAIIDSELEIQAANNIRLPPQGNVIPAGIVGLIRRYPCASPAAAN